MTDVVSEWWYCSIAVELLTVNINISRGGFPRFLGVTRGACRKVWRDSFAAHQWKLLHVTKGRAHRSYFYFSMFFSIFFQFSKVDE